jgi:hypothetical protein
MIIFDLPYIRGEVICFVNLSGLVELRVRNSRIIRYVANLTKNGNNNKKNDKLLLYLRIKLKDELIYKIIPYKTIQNKTNDMNTYAIIRNPLQRAGEFMKAFVKFTTHNNCYDARKLFINDNIELFNNFDFVNMFCMYHTPDYRFMPDRFKSNKKIIWTAVIYDFYMFREIPDKLRSSKKFIMSFIKKIKLTPHRVQNIYQFLSYELRKDPEIVSVLLSGFDSFNKNEFDSGMERHIRSTVYTTIVRYIPDNLINNRNFLLSVYKFMPEDRLSNLSMLYSYTSIELKRDYEIILKLGYLYIEHKIRYADIMTPEMKCDVELHKKLVKLNPNIYDLMSDNLKNMISKN